jgi:hypothetical protein
MEASLYSVVKTTFTYLIRFFVDRDSYLQILYSERKSKEFFFFGELNKQESRYEYYFE